MARVTSDRRPPKGLDAAGRVLWRQVTEVFDLRPDERALLEQACRTADELARIVAALQEAPATVPGSKGQLRQHPLWEEARKHRACLRGLLRQLDLPEEEPAGAAGVRSRRARRAAQARWLREANRGGP